MRQPEEVIPYASTYVSISWLGLYPYAINLSLRRYLQNQSILKPQLISSLSGLLFNTTLNFLFVFIFKFESVLFSLHNSLAPFLQFLLVLFVFLLYMC